MTWCSAVWGSLGGLVAGIAAALAVPGAAIAQLVLLSGMAVVLVVS